MNENETALGVLKSLRAFHAANSGKVRITHEVHSTTILFYSPKLGDSFILLEIEKEPKDTQKKPLKNINQSLVGGWTTQSTTMFAKKWFHLPQISGVKNNNNI